ncbi:MAG: hypothetical protein JRN21_10000 [Nitrososphaerota archaeon]|nr:hypothetical protein [Nitrososphaerota archaeon]
MNKAIVVTQLETMPKAKQDLCDSPYHRHNSILRGGEYDECEQGGEHMFGGYTHKLVGQILPWYNCVKCGKAAIVLYKCPRGVNK